MATAVGDLESDKMNLDADQRVHRGNLCRPWRMGEA